MKSWIECNPTFAVRQVTLIGYRVAASCVPLLRLALHGA